MLLQSFVSGVTWSVPRVALGKICSSCTWVSTRCSVMLRLWHGPGLLQMVGFEASVQRTARVGGRSCESRKRSFEEFQRVKRFKRGGAHTGTSF